MAAPVTVDTIAAVATAPGRGAVGILRLSGPQALSIARTICGGALPQPRQAGLRAFHDESGAVLDRGLVLAFHAPHSYTGEDLVELQAHGGPVVLDLLLQAATVSGARIARPGEFSERAFLNGKLDLAQAEAVADLIDAASRSAAIAATRSLDGEFSSQVERLANELTLLRAWIEGSLDFSDEDIDWLGDPQLRTRLQDWLDDLTGLQRLTTRGRRLREGLVAAIAGQPNVGKSTLLNRLAGTDAAIVSEVPGTTRDLLREHLVIEGFPLTVIDTAGLRETEDPIEREGIRRAWAALEKAEVVLFVIDDRMGETDADRALLARVPASIPLLRILNKCDLSRQPAGLVEQADAPTVRLSAADGAGMQHLRGELARLAGFEIAAASSESQSPFTARSRHVSALAAARQHYEAALARLSNQSMPELMAEELRMAQHHLGEITGVVSSEDLLGTIFAGFCIGK